METSINRAASGDDILVVDDATDCLRLLTDTLHAEGYRVRPTKDPERALESALDNPPDLILLDVKMPVMDGFELCQKLKQDERTAAVPIIFVSVLQELNERLRGFEVGGVDFITKPLQREDALARIRTHLELARMRKQLHTLVEELELSEKQLRRYTSIVDQYVLTSSTDKDGVITSVSDAFCRVSGYSRDELIGRNHNLLRHPDMPEATYQELWQTIQSGQSWSGEILNRRKDGSDYWVQANIGPIKDENGSIVGYTAIRHDITDKKQAEELSITDPLTQIFNRLKLDSVLYEEIIRGKRYGQALSLIMLDVDHFKTINDTHGHSMGDTVLIQIADLIRSSIREIDVLGRWGGEEFLVVCPETDLAGAAALAEKLRAAIEGGDFPIEELITCSFGAASYQTGETLDDLIGRTDSALYLAKEHGRNRIEISADPV
jgi:diguanylate cyclase (GGDEF)-like protein/PAS domain S-box-containing protein